MCWQHKSNWVTAYTSIAILIISGYATTKSPCWEKTAYGTWGFSQEEVEMLPNISIRKILSSITEDEVVRVQILVKTQSLDGFTKVKRLSGHEDVYVTDAHGQEVKIKIARITEIQSIRKIKINPRKKKTGETAEKLVEFALYAPFIPAAIVLLPFLKSMGLDAGKNADGDVKHSAL